MNWWNDADLVKAREQVLALHDSFEALAQDFDVLPASFQQARRELRQAIKTLHHYDKERIREWNEVAKVP